MAGTDCLFHTIKIHIFLIHTAVLTGAADSFYSTYFFLPSDYFPKPQFIFKKSASALWQVRFFVVGKRLFVTARRSRAPPSSLDFLFSKNFKIGGNLNEN